MSGILEWEAKLQTEIVARYADFSDELATNESISVITFSKSVWSGNDPGAASLTITPTIINNSFGLLTVVQVNLAAGILGTIYAIDLLATTNLSRVISKSAAFAIKPGLY